MTILPQHGEVWRHNQYTQFAIIEDVERTIPESIRLSFIVASPFGGFTVRQYLLPVGEWFTWKACAVRLHPNPLAEENATLRERVAELERERDELRLYSSSIFSAATHGERLKPLEEWRRDVQRETQQTVTVIPEGWCKANGISR